MSSLFSTYRPSVSTHPTFTQNTGLESLGRFHVIKIYVRKISRKYLLTLRKRDSERSIDVLAFLDFLDFLDVPPVGEHAPHLAHKTRVWSLSVVFK